MREQAITPLGPARRHNPVKIRHLFPLVVFCISLAACSPDGGSIVPNAPTNVTARAQSSTSIVVTWSPVENATSYDVYYESASSPLSRITTVSNTTSYTHSGRQPNTDYGYFVTAKNDAGTSDYSSRASVRTPLNDAGGQKPDMPTGVTAALLSSGSIRITWNVAPGASSYDVYYTVGSSSNLNFAANVISPPYTHGNLQPGTGYYYLVKAKNSAGESGLSSSSNQVTTPTGNPPTVTTPTVTYTVTFNANGGSGTVPAALTVNAGSSVTLPGGSGLSKSGSTFGGWNTNASGTGTNYPAGSSFAPTGNVTLYARWENNSTTNPGGTTTTYAVTFNANGGIGTTPAAQTVEAGRSITLPTGNGLSRSGYTFGGWATNAAATGTIYSGGAAFTPESNILLYAKWDSIVYYNVFFNANGGGGTVPNSQTAQAGSSITLPAGSGLSRSGYTFGGWNTNASGTGTNYTAGSSFTPTGNVTLYARWDLIGIESVTGLANKLTWLENNAQSGGNYTVEISANESISPQGFYYWDRSNITITLRGSGTNRVISSSSYYSTLFSIPSGVTLVLDNNITVQGNNSDVILVNGGALRMNAGSAITGSRSSIGTAVYVSSGSFTMSGGTISGNGASDRYGGAVGVYGGSFTMSGGTISGNTGECGGGVFLWRGGFTMSGGTISGNYAFSFGGGVCVFGGAFNMNGGTISGNTVERYSGGGVFIGEGTFSKTGGTITGYASDQSNGNVVRDGSGVRSNSGHAVYAIGAHKRKETTAGPGVNLSFNGSTGSFSGAWDD